MERISKNIPYISLFFESKKSYGTNQYDESKNDKDSGGQETVQLMEENKFNGETAASPKISSLEACWNVLNLIQGKNTLTSVNSSFCFLMMMMMMMMMMN